MATSYAQSAPLSCPSCGQSFEAEIWLIVDVSERPDLRERLRSGLLHQVICPHCGHAGQIDAPVLVLLPVAAGEDGPDGVGATGTVELSDTPSPQPARSPRQLYPAPHTTPQPDREHAAGLVTTLTQSMGDAWREEWVAEGLRIVARNLLPAALSDDPETALRQAAEQAAAELERLRQQDPAAYEEFAAAVKQAATEVTAGDPFLAGLAALGEARTPRGFLRVAHDHPILLSQDGAIRVHEGVADARRSGQVDLADDLKRRYEALCEVVEAVKANGLTLDQALEVAQEIEG